ncbi:MAG: cysteine desulfurase [Clostridia bacterium]|nr:cysteine desulfurase [Clostridia bacterium]
MIYLDNSATTAVSKKAAETASSYMNEVFFNPSSAYNAAVAVERDMKQARAHMARALAATPDEFIYTSGGTESNNAAIFGTLKMKRTKGRVICSAVEHPSVYEVFSVLEGMGYEVKHAPVNSDGAIDTEALSELVTPDTLLVSLMHVNNETGAINDLEKCRKIIKSASPEAIFHSDGVQAFCKMPFVTPACDLYSVSGHKIHAPKGIGILYIKKNTKFFGSLIGGGQERGLRSGTSNVPSIMAFDVALEDYMANREEYVRSMMNCKMRLAKNMLTLPDTVINGCAPEVGAPHILNISFLGVRGEVLLHSLAERGIYVSTGSACSTHKKGNRILDSMGIRGERQAGAIRFSFCAHTTEAEIDEASNAISEILPQLRRFKRR